MRRFEALAYAGLALILVLYAEETVHYAFHRHAEMIFPLSTSACQPIPGDAGFYWCNVSGYGRTRFQRSRDSYEYADPSSPAQTWDEINDRSQTRKQMFEYQPRTPPAAPPVAR